MRINLFILRDGTIKEGYQVYVVRGCRNLKKDKGWINSKKHKNKGFFGQICNYNQEEFNSFEE